MYKLYLDTFCVVIPSTLRSLRNFFFLLSFQIRTFYRLQHFFKKWDILYEDQGKSKQTLTLVIRGYSSIVTFKNFYKIFYITDL